VDTKLIVAAGAALAAYCYWDQIESALGITPAAAAAATVTSPPAVTLVNPITRASSLINAQANLTALTAAQIAPVVDGFKITVPAPPVQLQGALTALTAASIQPTGPSVANGNILVSGFDSNGNPTTQWTGPGTPNPQAGEIAGANPGLNQLAQYMGQSTAATQAWITAQTGTT
jgi:hypothetical protein